MIDTATVGVDTYKSSASWSSILPSLYQPAADESREKISVLRQKFQEHSSKNALYQAYLHDLNILDRFRKKKSVSLQNSAFKSESETMNEITYKLTVK